MWVCRLVLRHGLQPAGLDHRIKQRVRDRLPDPHALSHLTGGQALSSPDARHLEDCAPALPAWRCRGVSCRATSLLPTVTQRPGVPDACGSDVAGRPGKRVPFDAQRVDRTDRLSADDRVVRDDAAGSPSMHDPLLN
jgi:hypothetical protein